MKKAFLSLATVLLVSGCTSSNTASIATSSVEPQVRQFCPAFKRGEFETDSARSYGSERVTTFQNGSRFNCRCFIRTAGSSPTCSQVRRFTLGNID
jgi:hypothetical protein